MKLTAPYSLFLLLLLISCKPKSTPESLQDMPPGPNNQVEVPAILLNLFSPNAGVFRGVDFDKDLAVVMASDSAEVIEKTDKSLTYTFDFSDLEFADYQYEADSASISRIKVDIYAATPASAQYYHQQLKEFFDAKYRPRTEGLWDGSENGIPFTAFLKSVETGEDLGVFIVWEAEKTK